MKLNFGGAIREALKAELSSNEPTVFMGQDLQYNLYGYTEGLTELFGKEKILNTPISEASVVGTAIGAALCGVRTIVDLTVANFIYIAMDQIVNIASKNAYMYNGKLDLPLTIMCGEFYDCGNAAQHSDRIHSLFINFPGLKIVTPNTPQNAYSLLRSSINDRNPVLYFSDRTLFYEETEVDLELKINIGDINIVRKGEEITLLVVAGCLKSAIELEVEFKARNLSVELIEISTINPLDIGKIYESVKKTGRVVIADTSNRSGSVAEHISSLIVENLFFFLKAPIKIVAFEDVPVPFANNLEKILLPSKRKLLDSILYVSSYDNQNLLV